MSKDVFDNELNDYLEKEEEKCECSFCGCEIEKGKTWCSKECMIAEEND